VQQQSLLGVGDGGQVTHAGRLGVHETHRGDLPAAQGAGQPVGIDDMLEAPLRRPCGPGLLHPGAGKVVGCVGLQGGQL